MGTARKAGRLSADETLKLWQEYKTSEDPRVRDRLVLTFAPMVKYIVYRKIREIPARCEVGDFISCGLEALIRSLDRYDPEKGATLERFIWTRVHGAVLDELRRNDWAPRSLRRWDRDITKAGDEFVRLHSHRPSVAELSEAMGVTTADLNTRMAQIARSRVGSLNTVVLAEDDTTIEKIDTLPSLDTDGDPELFATREEGKAKFRAAFEQLPSRDQKVVVLLYVHNLTLREIGGILGVTESRVCQIHGQILRKLRNDLESDEALFSFVA